MAWLIKVDYKIANAAVRNIQDVVKQHYGKDLSEEEAWDLIQSYVEAVLQHWYEFDDDLSLMDYLEEIMKNA